MAVIKYSYKKDKDKKLSEHFTAGEFRSHYNNELTTDEIYIDEELITKLEELINELDATKAIITSGYRDSKCDKLVGGNGIGQHTLGKAADVIFYKDNEIIDTKLISCKAQDLNIKGIARINERAIHLDVRTNGKYYGDETKETNSVTNDFYEYYGINKEDNYKEIVKSRFGFDDTTIEFLENHPYKEALFKKLATKK